MYERNVLHRDLKPDNIYIKDDTFLKRYITNLIFLICIFKIADFGGKFIEK